MVDYGRRHYDPRNGRFLGRDPIEERGGLNLYGFVGNNPTNRWDVLGMFRNGEIYHSGTGGDDGWMIYLSDGPEGAGGYNLSLYDLDGWILLGTDDPNTENWFFRSLTDYANEMSFADVVGSAASSSPPTAGGGGSSSPDGNDDRLRKECDEILEQARRALRESEIAQEEYARYLVDPDRHRRLSEVEERAKTLADLTLDVAFNVFGVTTFQNQIAQLYKQAVVDLWRGAYSLAESEDRTEVYVNMVGLISTMIDIGGAVADVSFEGVRGLGRNSLVGKINPYVNLMVAFYGTLDSLEEYSHGRQAIREELDLQKQRLDRINADIQRFGKTSENFMAMWRHKGCDELL